MRNSLRFSAACAALALLAVTDLVRPPAVGADDLSGVIRTSGDAAMAPLMRAWERGFAKLHPGVQFVDSLKGTASGIYGIEMRTADIALMGRQINPFERYGTYERAWVYPVELEVATGAARTLRASPAFAIFVNAKNPLARLTIAQLDRVFGAERSGGWHALSWAESARRPASLNIRTWEKLGVASLAGKPIHVYGPPGLGTGAISFFQARVLDGGEMWNEDLREYDDRAAMIAALARDPLGIAYAPIAYAKPGVKAIALAETSAGPYVPLDTATVQNRTYPLARPVYAYYTIDDEKTEIANPRVRANVAAFLRYVLSPQGRRDVAASGVYLPLPAPVAARQLQKLESKTVPPERKLIGE